MFDKLKAFAARAKVVLTALPTYLVGASVLITALAGPIAEALPAPWADKVTAWVVVVLAALASAVTIVRNVTRVFGDEVGLLGGES